MKDRRSQPDALAGLSPLARELAREAARLVDQQQAAAAARRRFEKRLAAANAGLALNPTWPPIGIRR